ncbi:MAG: fasciclin domain-containing protein [Solirubrobacteraceae bacterium]
MSTIKHYIALAAIAAVSVTAIAPAAGAATHREGNIVQTAAAAGQFKTLLTLAKQAGLAGALAGKGPVTVFAPTDAAFAKVPKATLVALAHDRNKLRAVLLYHVLKGKVTAAKLLKLHSVQTLNGQSLKVRVTHGTVTVGGVPVIKANVPASNGIIHAIGGVLIPR